MKVIKVPPPVVVSVPNRLGNMVKFVDETKTIVNFLQDCFDSYEPFSKGHVMALLYVKLSTILKDTLVEKGELWFEDKDFEKVEGAVAAIQWVTAKMNAAYIPFYEAVKAVRTETQVPESTAKAAKTEAVAPVESKA